MFMRPNLCFPFFFEKKKIHNFLVCECWPSMGLKVLREYHPQGKCWLHQIESWQTAMRVLFSEITRIIISVFSQACHRAGVAEGPSENLKSPFWKAQQLPWVDWSFLSGKWVNQSSRSLGFSSQITGINRKIFSDELNICGFPQSPSVLCTPSTSHLFPYPWNSLKYKATVH